MADRVIRADLHTHTFYSPDSITSPERLVGECRRRGIDCLAVTEHNTIKGALAVREIASFQVIVGEEVRSAQGEILGLFLTEEVPPGLSPEETVQRIIEQGGLVGIPHPFDRFRGALEYEAMRQLAAHIHFIEAFNARTTFPGDNGRALRYAQGNGLPVTAGSDAHSPWEVGRAYVEMSPFDGPQSFLAALRTGRIVGQLSNPLVHLASRWAWLRRQLGWRPI